MDKFKDIETPALQSQYDTQYAALQEMLANESPTIAQVEEATSLAVEVEEMKSELDARVEAANKAGEAFRSLQSKFGANKGDKDQAQETDDAAPEGTRTIADADEINEADTGGDPTHEETVEESPGQVVEPGEVAPAEAKDTKAASKGLARLAKTAKRPEVPDTNQTRPLSITAAAEVPQYANGQKMDMMDVAKGVINRARGFSAPNGDGESVNLQKFGTANFQIDFPEELTIDRPEEAEEVLKYATDEHRLPKGSLVAAGGWCAPSETVYDLDQDATTEGMLSLPEVNVKRGGMRFAQSPDFAAFYANPGFVQTETQAIAGTTKPCVEVSCPSFTDVRLDVEGICIKVPILTNVGYPEAVKQFIEGTLIAHQHWINANVIGRLVTSAGAARVVSGIGSTVDDTMGALELLADQRRQQWRLSFGVSMEVVVPFWVKGALRSDLAARTGQQTPVTDQQVAAFWAARNLNVQYVYDWQPLPTVDVGGTAGTDEAMTYPTTFNALMYPAGTFVKGVSDVISLNTVYDAASLATNVYTGLFAEQGFLVAKKKFAADLVTIPVCSAGRTGAHDLTCSAANWA